MRSAQYESVCVLCKLTPAAPKSGSTGDTECRQQQRAGLGDADRLRSDAEGADGDAGPALGDRHLPAQFAEGAVKADQAVAFRAGQHVAGQFDQGRGIAAESTEAAADDVEIKIAEIEIGRQAAAAEADDGQYRVDYRL